MLANLTHTAVVEKTTIRGRLARTLLVVSIFLLGTAAGGCATPARGGDYSPYDDSGHQSSRYEPARNETDRYHEDRYETRRYEPRDLDHQQSNYPADSGECKDGVCPMPGGSLGGSLDRDYNSGNRSRTFQNGRDDFGVRGGNYHEPVRRLETADPPRTRRSRFRPNRTDDLRPADYTPLRNRNRYDDRLDNHSQPNLTPADFHRPAEDRYPTDLHNRNDYRTPSNDYRPLDDYHSAQPVRHREPSAAEKIEQRISSRYRNPVVMRFAKSMDWNRATQLYAEVSRTIDSRHYDPAGYDVRARQAIVNLGFAVRNTAFLDAHGLNPSSAQTEAFRREIAQLSQRQVRNLGEAQQLMTETARAAQTTMRIPANTVAVEFIYAAAESLDKYSTLMPDDVNRTPSASLEDHVVGIGVEIKPHDDGVLVVKALRGGPAASAGLESGDVIVSVNGRSLRGKGLDYTVDQIGGPEGSRLTLSVVRDGRSPQNVQLTRSRVRVYSVSEVKMFDGGVGYIKLDKFAQSSDEEVNQALWSLHEKGMKSLIFDVRGNPGGLLTTAISLSDKFVPQGTIVSTRGRNPQDNTSETANWQNTWKTPLVVLVDGDSASASEIFAAAVQENGRGVIVGRQSYGKGTVQTHFPLQSVSGNLKLTTARFFSPKGREMAGNGVIPDVTVSRREGDFATSNTNDADIRAALKVAVDGKANELANNWTSGRNSRNQNLSNVNHLR